MRQNTHNWLLISYLQKWAVARQSFKPWFQWVPKHLFVRHCRRFGFKPRMTTLWAGSATIFWPQNMTTNNVHHFRGREHIHVASTTNYNWTHDIAFRNRSAPHKSQLWVWLTLQPSPSEVGQTCTFVAGGGQQRQVWLSRCNVDDLAVAVPRGSVADQS